MGTRKTGQCDKIVFFTLLPLLISSILAVQFPRALAFLPLVSILASSPFILRQYRDVFMPFKGAFLYLAGFLLFLTAHSVFIAEHDAAIDRLTKLAIILPLGCLFVAVMAALRSDDVQKYLRWMMYASALAAMVIFIEIEQGFTLYKLIHTGDVFSTAAYNRSSLVVVFVFLASFFMLKDKKQKTVLLSFVPVLLMLSAVYSQSAQLLFIFCVAFYFLFPVKSKMAWAGLAIGIVAAMLSMPFIMPGVFNGLPSFVDEVAFLKSGYVGYRFEIWDYISRKIYDHPFIGHGLEFTKTYETFDTQARYAQSTHVLHPHNAILQIWIELGVVGALIAGAGVLAVLRALYTRGACDERGCDEVRGALTIFIGFIFVSCFSYGMWQSWWLGLAFILAGWCVFAVKNASKAEKA